MGWTDYAKWAIPGYPAYAAGKKLLENPGLSAVDQARQKLLNEQAAAAGSFADYGEGGFKSLGTAADNVRAMLEAHATGQQSFSRESLRQGLGQQLSQQRSLAAGAGANSPMAALAAAQNMGRASYGMSGQAALADIAERQAFAKALADATMQQRQQELQAALGSRQTAVGGYSTQFTPQKSFLERNGPAISGGLGLLASDERLKTNVKDGRGEASRVADAIRAYAYDYKDPKYGAEKQLGVMAQDLEKVGLKQAVVDTPAGKMVHAGKLAGANTAMIGALAERVRDLESSKPRTKKRKGR